MAQRPIDSRGTDSDIDPPYTATTDASYDHDAGRPTTSAGGRHAQWTYGSDSRPTTSRAGPTGDYQHYDGQDDYIDEEEEEEEESEDEDVFAYLPPNTVEHQQLQQLQNAHAQQQLQQQQAPQYSQSVPRATDTPQFAYAVPTSADSHPPASRPSATTASTPYSPASPVTPSSAVPLHHLTSYYGHQPVTTTTQSVDSSPPDTQSSAPPFAYDPPSSGEPYVESYRMTPMSASVGPPPSSQAMSVNVETGPTGREVHISLPSGHSSSRKSADYASTPPADAGISSTLASRTRNRSLDDVGLRYRPDSKRTKGSSSADSVELRHGSESVKTDISLTNGYTPTLPSTPGGHHPHGHLHMEEDVEDSPYPEVRASVSNVDDPEMPALTFRTWCIGLVLCMIGTGLNQFFQFRYPAPYVAPVILLLVAFPCGKALAYSLPINVWTIPSAVPLIGGWEFTFNPGPFSIKEHVLIFIMANVSVNPAYGMNVIVVSERYYGYRLGAGFSFLLILATQLTGFALSGFCRRFLVWPASLIWPANLVTCTLLNTLHAEDDEVEGGGISRYRFFLYATTCAFIWYFVPGWLFQALSYFSFVCWIRPHNIVINQMFGVISGLGMSVLTFDWSQIAYIGSPLMVPWWAEVHIFAGFVFFYWILCPILYYTDAWNMSHLPISGNGPFDRFAKPYNVTRVLTSDMRLNQTAYEAYSPLYLPATYVITYLLAFMLSTAVLVHTALYHGRGLLNGIKRIKMEEDDVHAKLMRAYPEVPHWWYATVFVVFFTFAIVAVSIRSTDTPVWSLVLALIIPIVYVIPSGYIYAMTGQPVGINLVAEIIPGTLFEGQPLANMIFKCYAVQTMQVALAFIQDLKLGHYMKCPPRATFLVQATATSLACIVQVGVKEALFAGVKDLCHPDQPNKLTCPNNEVFFAASAVWGLIGPRRQFGEGAVYHLELYALIIGAFLPVPFWWWQRKYPKSRLKYINMPVLLNGPTFIPPAGGINFSSWFTVGFIFQYLVRTRSFRWWSKFNYVLSASLDAGTILSVVFIFLTLQLPKGGTLHLKWWGNTVFVNTADVKRIPYRSTPPEGF